MEDTRFWNCSYIMLICGSTTVCVTDSTLLAMDASTPLVIVFKNCIWPVKSRCSISKDFLRRLPASPGFVRTTVQGVSELLRCGFHEDDVEESAPLSRVINCSQKVAAERI